MKLKPVMYAVLVLGLTTAVQAQINKCEVDGVFVYTDQPCPSGTSQELELDSLNTLPPPKEASYPATAEPEGKTYRSSVWYEDSQGYETALRISQRHKAPILIYARTDWCPYCRKFEQALLPTPQVTDAFSRYVKVRLNPDHGDSDMALFKRLGGTGYPTIWLKNSSTAPPVRAMRPFYKKQLVSPETFASFYFAKSTKKPVSIIGPPAGEQP